MNYQCELCGETHRIVTTNETRIRDFQPCTNISCHGQMLPRHLIQIPEVSVKTSLKAKFDARTQELKNPPPTSVISNLSEELDRLCTYVPGETDGVMQLVDWLHSVTVVLPLVSSRIKELETVIRDCSDDGLNGFLLRNVIAANPDLGEPSLMSLQHCAESFDELWTAFKTYRPKQEN